jgi:hypothetical protein
MAAATTKDLVESLIGPVEPFQPGRRLTTFAGWYTTSDGGTLVLAVEPGTSDKDAALAAAHALAWQHDRDLVLLLPQSAVPSIAARLTHVATPVRVWAVGEDRTAVETPIPSDVETVAEARRRPLRRGEQHDLGERARWVDGLTASANGHWALVQAHRDSYLSWHCAGRQVLKLSKRRDGVHIEAGVQYRKPPADRPPFTLTASGPLTNAQRAQAEGAIALAVADRLTGRDGAHVEHQMQAALAASGLRDLGMVQIAREYPAWRGDGAAGYIDFLGLDERGQIHVVETKIGPDAMLVSQALDYATWVRAHAPAIRRDLRWPHGDDSVIHIDFVLAPKVTERSIEPAVGPYTAGQLEALGEDVSWRVHFVDDARAESPVITSEDPRRVPGPRFGRVAEPLMPARKGMASPGDGVALSAW